MMDTRSSQLLVNDGCGVNAVIVLAIYNMQLKKYKCKRQRVVTWSPAEVALKHKWKSSTSIFTVSHWWHGCCVMTSFLTKAFATLFTYCPWPQWGRNWFILLTCETNESKESSDHHAVAKTVLPLFPKSFELHHLRNMQPLSFAMPLQPPPPLSSVCL